MRWNIIVECVGEDGKQSTITLGTIERLAGSTTAENLGVNLQESKQIVNRLQDTVVKQQLQEHCEQRRNCLTCGRFSQQSCHPGPFALRSSRVSILSSKRPHGLTWPRIFLCKPASE